MSVDINMAKKLTKAINYLIDERLKALGFNYFIEGKITADKTNGLYDVDVNETISTIPSINGITYKVGEIVVIMIPNGNYHERYIDHKIPSRG